MKQNFFSYITPQSRPPIFGPPRKVFCVDRIYCNAPLPLSSLPSLQTLPSPIRTTTPPPPSHSIHFFPSTSLNSVNIDEFNCFLRNVWKIDFLQVFRYLSISFNLSNSINPSPDIEMNCKKKIYVCIYRMLRKIVFSKSNIIHPACTFRWKRSS